MIVTIFCASSKKVDKIYFDAAIELANSLLGENITIRYGGGAVGLMGAIANRFIEKNGKIVGIIPEFMVKVEWAHPDVTNLIVVNDMHERKKLLIEGTDAVIALPGGSGTLEELMEVFSLKRLGKFLKPIVLLNTNGFYNPLESFINQMVEEKFMRVEHQKIWTIVNEPAEVIPAIKNAQQWDPDSINFASA